MQNVCKAENVIKVLETWEEVLLSVCFDMCAMHVILVC